ncbi:hypothetical protein [Nocardiopsis sp. CA-288880]|uniref:hypothetical protein n=1 Tax=Nocardiopsis sp. CA-288880 TaxID=3239995 RepID=UPI003D96A3CB
MSATPNPERFFLPMVAVMFTLMLAVSLPLVLLTSWPTWLTALIGSGAGGLVSPFLVRWTLDRRERVRSRPSANTGEQPLCTAMALVDPRIPANTGREASTG